jgi:hypothetical protein
VTERETETATHPANGRTVIHATCPAHSTARGFTNLVMRRLPGRIVLDPHALECVVELSEEDARVLRDTLTEWLG